MSKHTEIRTELFYTHRDRIGRRSIDAFLTTLGSTLERLTGTGDRKEAFLAMRIVDKLMLCHKKIEDKMKTELAFDEADTNRMASDTLQFDAEIDALRSFVLMIQEYENSLVRFKNVERYNRMAQFMFLQLRIMYAYIEKTLKKVKTK